jgi:exopolyphosphatase/guanosine-5'-triphosphate,3'-diphosphate pyrophosphatase
LCDPSRFSVFAAIDVGSHTVRLLVARLVGRNELAPLRVERRITRLAMGFQEGNNLTKAAIDRSIAVLREYSELLRQYGVCSTACGATGVVRRALNRHDFLRAVSDCSSIECSPISEESEAVLSTKGILSVLPGTGNRVLSFDLGGSSTEFTLSEPARREPLWNTSIFTGAATVTERYLAAEDPPSDKSIERARAAIRKDIAPAIAAIKCFSGDLETSSLLLVGTAGTVTTLAAMYFGLRVYEPYRVNGSVLAKSWIEEMIDRLAGLPISARSGIPGLEEGREDIILGGALIVSEILNALGLSRLTVTDAGLLEGLLLDLVERHHGLSRSLASPLTWQLQKG